MEFHDPEWNSYVQDGGNEGGDGRLGGGGGSAGGGGEGGSMHSNSLGNTSELQITVMQKSS